MKTQNTQFKIPRQRRRCVELYAHDTPFRQRVERNRKIYQRQVKHINREL